MERVYMPYVYDSRSRMVLHVKFLRLVLALGLLVGCSAVKLNEFVGFPFKPSTNHKTFPSNDDSSLRVAFTDTRPVIVNGIRYKEVHINNNGAITFSQSSGTYRPNKFPFIGSEYLAVLWTDIDTRGCSLSNATNTVYYKEITGKDLGSSCTFEEINNIVESSYEFKSIAGCTRRTFQTRWAFVVTWHEVGFYGERCNTSSDFQVVVATDGALTYAIYNYGRIQNQERDTAVGVNAGDGVHYHLHPNSHSHLIFDIEDHPGNTGALGQWVYRIDVISNETRSLCSGAVQLAQANTETKGIRLIPSTGTVFGGTAVRVIGPCAKDVEDIKCTFGSQVVDGTFSPANGQIICVTPEFADKNSQRLPFSVTFIKDGINNIFKSNFYTTIVTNDVKIVGDKEPLEVGDRVSITWDPDFLAVPNPMTFTVDIAAFQLVGENINSHLIGVVLSNIPNSGQATFTIPDIETTDTIALVLYKVTLSEEHSIRKRQNALEGPDSSTQGSAPVHNVNGMEYRCQEFLAANRDGAYLLELVEPCPVTVANARAASSGFKEESDICLAKIISAARVNNSKDADVCFKQRNSRPGTTAGNNCCYGADGNLCTYVGCAGAIDKVLPKDGNTTTCMQHFIEDLQHHHCPNYYQKRPIYTAPPRIQRTPACVYGDPHVVSLDTLVYTFNGKGEFTLIEAPDKEFVLQGRMELASDDAGEGGTVYSTLVAKESCSAAVQFEIGPVDEIILLVDGERVLFDEVKTFPFRNVTVGNVLEGVYTATFACGTYIEVYPKNGMISLIIISVDQRFRGKTVGLMGNYNGDTSDDLKPKGSNTPISIDSSLEEIHDHFGLTWIIDNAEDSLFTYRQGQSFGTFYDRWYRPAFGIEFDDPAMELMAMQVCDDDKLCLFDIAATNNVAVGKATKQDNVGLEKIIEQAKPIICNPECKNGGVCVKNDTCSCEPGFKGATCSEIDQIPCNGTENVCQNDATCTKFGRILRCDCLQGYTGLTCNQVTVVYRINYYTWVLGLIVTWTAEAPEPIEGFRLSLYSITAEGRIKVWEEEYANTASFASISQEVLTSGQRYYAVLESSIMGSYSKPIGFQFGYY